MTKYLGDENLKGIESSSKRIASVHTFCTFTASESLLLSIRLLLNKDRLFKSNFSLELITVQVVVNVSESADKH